VFERFTEPARRVLFFARYETSEAGHLSIQPEHLLIGLLRESHGPAGAILAEAGVRVADVRADLAERMPSPAIVPPSVEIPFVEETKRVLLSAATIADALGHRHVGTEHLLLALLQQESTPAAELLRRHGLHFGPVRDRIERTPPDTGGQRFRLPDADALVEHVVRIQQLVGQLVHAAGASPGLAELGMVIDQELEALKRGLAP
jgi:ATP-dependent Clp protease ATP-binding subunit ClpC